MYTSSVYFQCFILFLEKWVKFDNKKFACVLYVLCVENWNDIAYILMNHSISKNYCMCQNLIISIGISSYVIKTNISLITRQPGSITAFLFAKDIMRLGNLGICQVWRQWNIASRNWVGKTWLSAGTKQSW